MKISKSLLKSIMIGVTIGGAAACSIVEEVVPADKVEEAEVQNEEEHECDENCAEQCTESQGHTWDNCPGCGMG